MPRSSHYLITALVSLLVAGGLGYYFTNINRPTEQTTKSSVSHTKPFKHNTLDAHKSPRKRLSSLSDHHNIQNTPPLALENERILIFKDDASYQRFLNSLNARNLNLLGQSDKLRSVRVRIEKDANMDDLDDADIGYNYQVSVPTPPQASAQVSASGFGANALSWLGVTGDNSSWGQGVTVAVIDSGVNEHIALQGDIPQISLADLSEGSDQLGHGTAVASIISGDHQLTPGVAPASDILSIRVSDETGYSNSFTLAEGIIQATDAGADIINISMGSYGDSNMVANAVRYAQEQGAVIVASSGNEGLDSMAYPAAYEGVVSVGAVEQGGEHLDFSNTGETLSITAPGYQVNAAWGNEQLTSFSGTSASAPFVSGAIAATMSENPGMTANEAATRVVEITNDSGYPGSDPQYGSGVLDVGRIMDYGTAGIYDAAISSQILIQPESPTSLPEVWVTVQNQGTETLINSPVTITTPNITKNLNISSLAPGQTQTFNFPVMLPYSDEGMTINSTVISTQGDNDSSNNSQSSQFSRE